MTSVMCVVRNARLVGVLVLALAAAGCANKPNDPALAGAGNAPPGSQQDFVVNVGDRVFFESDSTELTPQSITTLERQAQWLQHYSQYAFTIEGHADERGTREYNLALGERRANAARDYLVNRGIAANRIETVSYGEEKPKHDNAREETRRLNRRAALVVRLQ